MTHKKLRKLLSNVEPLTIKKKKDSLPLSLSNESESSFLLSDFSENLIYTKPHKVSFKGTDYMLSSWKDLLREICILLMMDSKSRPRLLDLRGKPLMEFHDRICLRDSKQHLLSPLKITDVLWVESNFSARAMVSFVITLARICQMDLASVEVFYSTPFSKKMTSRTRVQTQSNLSFTKNIDWSTLKAGVTIPQKLHDIFLKNLSSPLHRGTSHSVSILSEGTSYQVLIANIGFSNIVRKPVLQFLWSKKSPIAQMLRMKFSKAYEQLARNHSDRAGIDDLITISCTSTKDLFALSFNAPKETQDFELQNIPQEDTDSIDLSSWISVLLSEFCNGFLFNSASVKLLEKGTGMKCSSPVLKQLKACMLKRSDDVFLLSNMIISDTELDLLSKRARELLENYGCFSLSVLYDEFKQELKNLLDPDIDFRPFLIKFVLPKIENAGEIFGKLQKQLCIASNLKADAVLQNLGSRLHDILRSKGDAVLVEELDDEFPYLNSSMIEMILQDYVEDAVLIELDDMKYWKLLDFFYLPDDFSDTLTHIITHMDQQGVASSMQFIETELNKTYSDGFRDAYDLCDDDVFRQVISVAFQEEGYEWKNKVFIPNTRKRESNIADEFLKTHSGIFHESLFFDYAKERRGMTNEGMLILTFLRLKCIRIDQYHWISLADFDNQSNFSSEIAELIQNKLKSQLGNHFFLSLGILPEALMSEFPSIKINQKNFYWNSYMLASIAAQKITGLRIVNDDPSPYTITAMLIPNQAQFSGDVLDYVFHNLYDGGVRFSSADMVFDYLKKQQVRMTKSKKLLTRIRDFWSVE